MIPEHERSKDLTSLGSQGTEYNFNDPDGFKLESFPNPMFSDENDMPGIDECLVTITSPEFTSLCPKTGQPDYAKIIVSYLPNKLCVESKSWKMYLNTYRNHGAFHEECCAMIVRHLVEAIDPLHLHVKCEFTPRGGIPFWPEITYNKPSA